MTDAAVTAPAETGRRPHVVVGVDGSAAARAALVAARSALLGSVAITCAMRAPCPVLVVRPPVPPTG